MDVKIPSDLPSGDYLLRAEAIALHTAASSGGAQLYMSCYQLTVAGSGAASPPTVSFPGAYKASDPGILVNIHAKLSTYVAPGPSIYAGGSLRTPGGQCANCAATCTAGKGTVGTALAAQPSSAASLDGSSSAGSTGATGGSSGAAACAQAAFQQCGGNGYTGCTTCGAGLSCKAVSPPYYSQCQAA
ncbi:hypothetical protein NKR23_g5959 [Pleurostoma richardsiae]|uniref:lytic cellulose monooxygenase (C4-dehydrogenating) n=1 Tax=Pleurostoma richardsiae TaxID=41990 RepID=A0AA38RYB9_9PEZI|nr:hypothetical protein NKR23_g5959 [Pleurostoma richardsiae]